MIRIIGKENGNAKPPPPHRDPPRVGWHISEVLGVIPTCEGTWRFVTIN